MFLMLCGRVVLSSIVSTKTDRCSLPAKTGTFGTIQLLIDLHVDVVFGPICPSGRLKAYDCANYCLSNA